MAIRLGEGRIMKVGERGATMRFEMIRARLRIAMEKDEAPTARMILEEEGGGRGADTESYGHDQSNRCGT